MQLLPFELRWFDAIARTLVQPAALGGTTADADLAGRVQEDCDVAPWYASLLLRFGLWLVWLAPLWRWGRPRTFGGLDAPSRERLLEELLDANGYAVRMTVNMLKLTACTLLLGDLRVLVRVGAYRLREAAPVPAVDEPARPARAPRPPAGRSLPVA